MRAHGVGCKTVQRIKAELISSYPNSPGRLEPIVIVTFRRPGRVVMAAGRLWYTSGRTPRWTRRGCVTRTLTLFKGADQSSASDLRAICSLCATCGLDVGHAEEEASRDGARPASRRPSRRWASSSGRRR